MATQERLMKSLDSLKGLIASNQTSDLTFRKKEKVFHCNVIADALCNSSIKIAPNFHNLLSCSMEILLQLCDDPESDVRMVADECLNRVIRAMTNGNVVKIIFELHKEIKKNGSARSLRAALWRFARLCHMIRPHKGKPYVLNLIPCIVKIAKRTEESVLETLASSLPKIMASLGSFISDNDVKGLLKPFFHNISNSSTVVRRTASTSIVAVCLNCRKPQVFITYVLNILIDLIIPLQENEDVSTILGVLNCINSILPHTKESRCVKVNTELVLSAERMFQVYELCVHYTSHFDHNVINAALETLNTVLLYASSELKQIFLKPNTIKSSQLSGTGSQLKKRTLSQISVATSVNPDDETSLNDVDTDHFTLDEQWPDRSKLLMSNESLAKSNDTLDAVDSIDKPTNNSDFENSVNINVLSPDLSADHISETFSKVSISDTFEKVDKPKPVSNGKEVLYQDVDVGAFTDSTIPLIYCCRRLVKSFLLTGHPSHIIPDENVRVSVKALALACVSTILRYYPKVLLMYLDQTHTKESKCLKQQISDILLYEEHSDPRMRGITRTLIGTFINTVLIESGRNYMSWIRDYSEVEDFGIFELQNLVNNFIKGLEDESSSCCRESLIGVDFCFGNLVESVDSKEVVPLLNILPVLVKNPYWLVKVKLAEFVSSVNYTTVFHVTGGADFEDKVVNDILFALLKDEDQRVRHAAASSIVRVIPFLYSRRNISEQDVFTSKAVQYRNKYLHNLFTVRIDTDLHKRYILNSVQPPFNKIDSKPDEKIEKILSKIIFKLSQQLLTSSVKYFSYGCIETLCLLSIEYLTTVYTEAWDNQKLSYKTSDSQNPEVLPSSMGLLDLSVSLLTNSTLGLDLNCQQWLLSLAGDVFSGLAVQSFKQYNVSEETTTKQLWSLFTDKHLCKLADQLLHHIVKMLNIFCHIIDENSPMLPQSKPVLPNLPTATGLSPIKRKKSDVTEKNKLVSPAKIIVDKEERNDKKGETPRFVSMGYFTNLPHYMKMYDVLKVAYTNYKITLDTEASEKFLGLLKMVMQTLSQILEVGSSIEAGHVAEEALFYFQSTVVLDPMTTVHCVQQLLKCLFGTNLSNYLINLDYRQTNKNSLPPDSSGFCYNIFQEPYGCFSQYLLTSKSFGKIDKDVVDGSVLSAMNRRGSQPLSDFKSLPRNIEKSSLASYIRLFEPMVIKSLKQYTITSDVKLQCQVLQLLSELVQLRVNYCLLDSDQIFIGFVLKQFDFIEEGQIPLADELIPKIFYFLVHLSYAKQHSKNIISIPKIIQLCDGLMASGQSPLTHCIPALIPFTEDIFLIRNQSNIASDVKEMEATREVLFSMLLRLIEYHQIINLLALIINDSRYNNDNGDKWTRWSHQVAEILLPAMKHRKIRLECAEAQIAMQSLISVLNPVVFKPVVNVLQALFSDPPVQNDLTISYCRWFGLILTSLLILQHIKEDVVLSKLGEIKSEISQLCVYKVVITTVDPLNVSNSIHSLLDVSSDVLFARFLFRVISIVGEHCLQLLKVEKECCDFLVEQFSAFLVHCLHMFQSGSFNRTANSAVRLIGNSDELSLVNELNKTFIELAAFYPLLALQWSYLLTLLSYNDKAFWSVILQTPKTDGIVHISPEKLRSCGKAGCVNLEVVRIGGLILYCDYSCENIGDAEQLTWLLVNHIETLIVLSNEVPVNELIASVHRNSPASGLFVQAVAARCADNSKVTFISKILKCLEGVHPSQSGPLLLLVIQRLLDCHFLALSRQAASLASRRIELLLTMTQEEVIAQLPKDDFVKIMDILLKTKLAKKHETLVSLLNKLGTHCYDCSPLDLDEGQMIVPENIKNIEINKTWYLAQVKRRCCQSAYLGKESAELLSKLDYDDVLSVMSDPNFSKLILKDCIVFGIQTIIKNKMVDEPQLLKAAVTTVMKHAVYIKGLIPKPHQVYKPSGRTASPSETKYSKRLTELFSDSIFWNLVYEMVPTISYYVEYAHYLPNLKVAVDHFEDLAKIGVLCLESVCYQLDSDNFRLHSVDVAVSCANVIFKQHNFCNILGLDSHISWLCSSINCVYRLMVFLLNGKPLPSMPFYGLKSALENLETVSIGHACNQLAVLISWLEKTCNHRVDIPEFLYKQIKSLIVSLGRLPLVNSYVLTPPSAWLHGWDAELLGAFNTQVPPLPVHFLQEIDILEEFVFRITTLGWTSRQQFEETWMCLLSVLNCSINNEMSPDEASAIIQTSSLTVQAITSLLLQTLLKPTPGNPNTSALLHVAREKNVERSFPSVRKLQTVHETLFWEYNEYAKSISTEWILAHVFNRPNLEKINSRGYSCSQLSVEYLWISANVAEDVSEDSYAAKAFRNHDLRISESGLDLHSCLQFLLDFYSSKTWTNTPLRLLLEIVRSVLVVSDLFLEKTHFQWMLNLFVDLLKSHPVEDDVLHQYLIVGACKAAAVLTPEPETYDFIKKSVSAYLKNGFLPIQIASLHGVLYLLQSSVIGNTVIGGVSEETQMIHPIVIEYLQSHIGTNSMTMFSEEHQLLMWALAFFLLENVEKQVTEVDVVPNVLQMTLQMVVGANVPVALNTALFWGFERLVITKSVSGPVIEQITKLALENIRNSKPCLALPALQLLLTCMYTESQDRLEAAEKENGMALTDPDTLVYTIEKVTAIFNHIKRGYPFEVKLLCSVLPNVLNDFFPPSEILTKAIGEFLSPQQPHPKILSKVVFQVFEKACEHSQLSLLQDWVVFSLPNFTQSLPVVMATWCLTCFFISASTNQWLRSLFPHFQFRIGRFEYEDKKMLCIAGADFYRNLSTDVQKRMFVDTFSKVKNQPGMPFRDLLASLQ